MGTCQHLTNGISLARKPWPEAVPCWRLLTRNAACKGPEPQQKSRSIRFRNQRLQAEALKKTDVDQTAVFQLFASQKAVISFFRTSPSRTRGKSYVRCLDAKHKIISEKIRISFNARSSVKSHLVVPLVVVRVLNESVTKARLR